MNAPPARGLPPRLAIPIIAVVAIVFLGIMTYFLRIGLGNSGTALGAGPHEQGDARIVATPVPVATDDTGTAAIPQTGGGVQAPNAPPPFIAQAISELRSRLARNPRDTAALVAFGDLEMQASKFDRAAEYYGRAAAVEPSNPATRTSLATAMHFEGNDSAALREVQTVLTKAPAFPGALFTEGLVDQRLGRRTEAIAAFKRFLAVAPSDRRAPEAHAALHDLGSS